MRRIALFALPFAALQLLAFAADPKDTASETPDVAVAAKASAPSPPASERDVESPDFRRHVVPMLGRLGCNGRACHGSFQGQGGFQLSLFGYDFAADHKALLGGKEPRVNKPESAKSLMLQKPTLAVDHEGGARLKADSWQYRLLKRWIDQGAKPLANSPIEFARLEIGPAEMTFPKPGETRQVKVIAHWTDGTSEDVTPLCRYRSNDDSVAAVDENGLVTSKAAGDTHVVAFYDNGVATVPVLMPVSEQFGEKYPTVATTTKIDELVIEKLRKLGVTQSETCDDAEFLRRVSLDTTGTLPTPKEVREFLADASPDKRKKKIDELLERPAYAAWWTTRLNDLTGNNAQQIQQALAQSGADPAAVSAQWYAWLYDRVSKNVPYDQIVAGLVLARSRQPGQSYEDYCKQTVGYLNGKPEDFAASPTLPHYWMRRNFRKSDEMALGFAYTFLGVQLQCAQCHKHPFDQWTKSDFNQFAGFFSRISYGIAPENRDKFNAMQTELGLKDKKDQELRKAIADLMKEGKALPMQELFVTPAPKVDPPQPNDKNARGNNRRPQGITQGKLLGGSKISLAEFDDPRQALMDWMRNDPTRYFARAFVNRVWANYFNVGIVNPPDDLNLANPPSNGPLLDYLARGFVERNYDMKWLHREITGSRTYQLSWRPNATNGDDTKNFSRAVPRRMQAEIAYDALVLATAGDAERETMLTTMSERSIGPAPVGARGGGRNQRGQYVLTAFGKPARTTNCDCERSSDPSLLQTIFLRNDNEMYALIDRQTGWLKQLEKTAAKKPTKNEAAQQLSRLEARLVKAKAAGDADQVQRAEARIEELKILAAADAAADSAAQQLVPTTRELIDEAYLRTLSRLPSDAERGRSEQHIAAAKTPSAGLRDLVWALLNTKEFIVNH